MKYLFFILIVLLFSFVSSDVAYAQPAVATEAPVQPLPLAKWDFSPTATKLIFADGREANLTLSVRKKLAVKTKVLFIENSCFPEVRPKNCVIDYVIGSYQIGFIWSKHSDPNKLKQVLVVDQYGNKTKLQNNISDLTAGRLFESGPAQPISSPIMTCESDEWTRNFPKKENQNVLVPVWAFEAMSPNSITNRNENQTVFQVNNVEMSVIGPNKWKIDSSSTAPQFEKLIPLADPNTIYYATAGRECSIQIRIEKSVVTTATMAESQPIENVYSFPLKKGIPKTDKFRETFSGALAISQNLKTTDSGKVE